MDRMNEVSARRLVHAMRCGGGGEGIWEDGKEKIVSERNGDKARFGRIMKKRNIQRKRSRAVLKILRKREQNRIMPG
jgi:hypothetical protein